jgi:hypothetical protein
MSTDSKNAPQLDAAENLIAAIAPAFGGRDAIKSAVGPEGLIAVTPPSGREIIAEAVMRPSRPALLETWQRVRAHAEAVKAVPVLIVPHLTRSLRDLTADAGINWVDLAGNATIAHPELLIHIQGRGLYRPPWGGNVDPFAPRSANVVRQLLAEPRRTWRQKDLVDSTGLSQPQASKVLSALQEMALVRRDDDGGLRVHDPDGLLDAWADAYRYGRQRIAPAHLSGDGIELARSLHDKLLRAGHEHWFTGLPAAWAYDHFARFRLVSVFVDADPEMVRRDLGLRESERGSNIHLLDADAQRLDIGQAQPDGLPCAHPGQVYVDLLGLPERAREAADHLRPLALAGTPA